MGISWKRQFLFFIILSALLVFGKSYSLCFINIKYEKILKGVALATPFFFVG